MNTQELIKDILKEAERRGIKYPAVRITASNIYPGKFAATLGHNALSPTPAQCYLAPTNFSGVTTYASSILIHENIDTALFNLRTELMRFFDKPKPSCDGKEVEIEGRRYVLREVK